MRTIEVDETVYTHIQSLAIPYEDKNPNDTLKRVFGLKAEQEITLEDLGLNKTTNAANTKSHRRTKAPKADLAKLIRSGFVEEGEVLFLIDYSGHRVSGTTAQIARGKLAFDGRSFAMSDLAKILLQKNGYRSDSVRGPAHWETTGGKSIRELWSEYLSREKASGAD